MCKTYSYFSVFIADKQGFASPDRESGSSRYDAAGVPRVLNWTDSFELEVY